MTAIFIIIVISAFFGGIVLGYYLCQGKLIREEPHARVVKEINAALWKLKNSVRDYQALELDFLMLQKKCKQCSGFLGGMTIKKRPEIENCIEEIF